MRILRFHIFNPLFIFASFIVSGQTLELKEDYSAVFLNEYLIHYEDTSRDLSFTDVQKIDFKRLESPIINFGYNNSIHWFKTSIKNSSSENVIAHLKNRNHYLENFTLYFLSDDSLLYSVNNGCLSNVRKKIIPLELMHSKEYTLYLKVESTSPLRIPVYLYSSEYLQTLFSKNGLFNGLTYGVLGFLFLLTILISVSIKEFIYVIYGICILSIGFFLLGYDDLLPILSEKKNPNLLFILSVKGIGIFELSYILFTFLFFSFKKENTRIKQSLYILIAVSCLHIIVFIFNYTLGNKLIYFLSPAIGFSLFIISFYGLFFLQMKYARFYFIATLLLLIGTFLHTGSLIGLIPNYTLSFYALKTAYLIQISIYAYAMADRFIIFNKQFTEILNEKVEERTVELEHALKKLQSSQQQLIQSEKMASVGILTAGLAHELNNPLNYINGGVELLKSVEQNSLLSNQEVKQAFNFIEDGYKRSANIVSSILEFSHSAEEIKTKISFEEIMNRTIAILKPHWEGKVQFNTNYQFNSKVPAFKSKIHQTFITLIDNAIHFSQIRQSHPEIMVSTSKDELSIFIDIQNNGPHIPQVDINKVFDPFFTTREVGTGSGLGLTNALAWIREHSGELFVRNMETGVVFTIKLPLDSKL